MPHRTRSGPPSTGGRSTTYTGISPVGSVIEPESQLVLRSHAELTGPGPQLKACMASAFAAGMMQAMAGTAGRPSGKPPEACQQCYKAWPLWPLKHNLTLSKRMCSSQAVSL